MIQNILLDALGTSSVLLRQIADNTSFNSWIPAKTALVASVISAIFAFVSAVYTIRTFNSQKETEQNTSRLNMSEQRRLLIEMIRHLYRNMVVSYSIGVKMKAEEFMAYPSEEHLRKMKVKLSDIHLNLFYRSNKEYREINKFYMELRNYNMELDVICDHFRTPGIDVRTKERDLSTLYFKCNHLTKRIMEIIKLIPKKKGKADEEGLYQEVRDILNEEIEEKNKMQDTIYSEPFEPYKNEKSFYAQVLYADDPDDFYKKFEENIRHECGLNSEGGEKIHMIAL